MFEGVCIMIRENQRFLNVLQVILDIFVLTFSLYLAWYIRVKTNLVGPGFDIWGIPEYATSLVFIIVLYTILNYFFGLYNPHRTDSISSEIKQIFKVNILGLLILITTLYIIEVVDYSRWLLALFAIFSTIFISTERISIRIILESLRAKGFNVQHILVIGAGELGERFAKKINKNFYIGYNINWIFRR